MEKDLSGRNSRRSRKRRKTNSIKKQTKNFNLNAQSVECLNKPIEVIEIDDNDVIEISDNESSPQKKPSTINSSNNPFKLDCFDKENKCRSSLKINPFFFEKLLKTNNKNSHQSSPALSIKTNSFSIKNKKKKGRKRKNAKKTHLQQNLKTVSHKPNSVKQSEALSKRMVILDGSNIAFGHSLNKEFSVEGLKIAIDYFEKKGHEVKAVVPQHRFKINRTTNQKLLNSLYQNRKIVCTPCKNLGGKNISSHDDRIILELALLNDAVVISNDSYTDFQKDSEDIQKIISTRVIGFIWCGDHFSLPPDPYGRKGPKTEDILLKCY